MSQQAPANDKSVRKIGSYVVSVNLRLNIKSLLLRQFVAHDAPSNYVYVNYGVGSHVVYTAIVYSVYIFTV